ncbi:hypothetical protein [Chitinophaga sp. LS1]|uniref:hypothetical protein n=1 Tax=Chitinophaga sp. LS1 TaxID=3051176 RepID=UPI002AAA769B|nr:hypothetical protein [Chitinophaga sp. LS1]WPV67878.1 hypothetical protein QQL36_03965 [Chitinophaga sp. LS1]
MKIPEAFNDIIKDHLNVNAAWLPITNTFQLGDYGIFSNGVFMQLGNIKEFGITYETAEGPDSSINFTSSETSVINFSGDAQVDVIPPTAIDAKVTMKFGRKGSFFVKSPVIQVKVMQNIHQIGTRLKATEGWKRKWKVVHQLYNAQDAAIFSTIAADTDLTFSGDVKALKALNLGAANINVNTSKEMGLEMHGKAGIIALGLFKLRWLGDGVKSMDFTQQDIELLHGEIEDDSL